MSKNTTFQNKTMQVVAVYKLDKWPQTYAAFYSVPAFETNGKDCDTPDVLAVLLDGLREKLIEQAKGFHEVGRVPMPATDSRFLEGKQALAFYSVNRAKALIERFDAPLSLNGEG